MFDVMLKSIFAHIFLLLLVMNVGSECTRNNMKMIMVINIVAVLLKCAENVKKKKRLVCGENSK